MVEKEGAQIIRPAGLLERFHISRQFRGFNACVVVAAKFNLTSTPAAASRAIQREEFYQAVTFAINVHPALSLGILDPGETEGVSSLIRMPTIDLEKGIRFSAALGISGGIALDIEEALISQFDTSSDDAPLWRFTVNPDNYVIFVHHHVLGDGQSGLAVLQTVLQALNEPHQGTICVNPHRFVTPPANLELLPNIESRLDCSPSLRGICRAVIDELLPGWTKSDIWTGNNVVEVLPSLPSRTKTRVRVVSLSPGAASQLLTRARSHKTSVTSVIHYAGVLVLSHLLSSSQHPATTASDTNRKPTSQANSGKPYRNQYKRLFTHVPVSLRSQANIPTTMMCDAASAISQIDSILPTDGFSFPCCPGPRNKDLAGEAHGTPSLDWPVDFPWSRAAQFSQVLKDCGPRARSGLGLLKFLDGKFESFWTSKLGKKRVASMELSNVGVWSLSQEAHDMKSSQGVTADGDTNPGATEADGLIVAGEPTVTVKPWTISSAYFAQDNNVVGAALALNVIGSPNGELNVCVTWGEGAVHDDFADAFVSALGHVLGELSGH